MGTVNNDSNNIINSPTDGNLNKSNNASKTASIPKYKSNNARRSIKCININQILLRKQHLYPSINQILLQPASTPKYKSNIASNSIKYLNVNQTLLQTASNIEIQIKY